MTDLIELKPQWTPESLYNWNIAPPPAASKSKTALLEQQQQVVTSNEGDEELVVDTQVVENEQSSEEEGERENKKLKLLDSNSTKEREPDEFNPLLFRALTSLGRKLQA